MKHHRALLVPVAFVTALLAMTLSAGPASADPVSNAASALKTKAIYVDPGATIGGKKITVDLGAIETAFGTQIKVAILPAGIKTSPAGSQIVPSLSGNDVLAVFSGSNFDADSNFLCSGGPLTALQAETKSHSSELKAGQYTKALVAWAADVKKIPLKTSSACSSSNGGTSTTGSGTTTNANQDTSSSTGWLWLVGLGGVAVVGGGGLALNRRRKRRSELDEAKANVMPYYDRLAGDVNTLNPGDNATARQALSDAAERYNSAGSQMSTASSVPQWAAVRRTALEGLQAAQTAREALGLPKGPELPPIDQARGEQLTEAQPVTVQGQQYQGYPSYTPGAPYYYGGGAGYPGGWYNFPFWETVLLGSVIGGGGWGWGGGGGYGAGYDNGFNAGQNQGGNDSANDSGSGNDGAGGWGDFGGGGGGGGWGDFGGGGGGGWGDFGGGGGGGDFGGGGGGGDGGSF